MFRGSGQQDAHEFFLEPRSQGVGLKVWGSGLKASCLAFKYSAICAFLNEGLLSRSYMGVQGVGSGVSRNGEPKRTLSDNKGIMRAPLQDPVEHLL